MASLGCHGDSDCNKTQIIRSFNLHINSRGNLFPIPLTTPTYFMPKLGRYTPQKSSRATLRYQWIQTFRLGGWGGGTVLKKFFSVHQASVWSKPGPLPWIPTVCARV